MSDFKNIRLNAKSGDTIHVTAIVTDKRGAQVMLFDDAGHQEFRKTEDSGNSPAAVAFNAISTITPPRGECDISIPSDGVWHIVYLPWAVSSFTATVEQKPSS